MSIELPVATRHRRDMAEKLLKATVNQNKQQQQEKSFGIRNSERFGLLKPTL